MHIQEGEKKSKYKYEVVIDDLRDSITTGRYAPGQRIPSELKLVKQYGVSRLTVARALRDLILEGLLARRVGSGTYVCGPAEQTVCVLGLLLPELGKGEIFQPVCQGLTQATQYAHHKLLLGRTSPNIPQGAKAQELCAQFIQRKVSGVFFAPLERMGAKDSVNQQIAANLDAAGIPIVLIDRDLLPFPRRSKYDLVGIDNRRAGYVLTEHLLNLGVRRIGFFGRPDSAPTLYDRVAGYREALLQFDAPWEARFVSWGDPGDQEFVQRVLESIEPQAFVCGNDGTAAVLMQTLLGLGVSIPQDIKIVGVDNVTWANLLPVPLTTLSQPCLEIGVVAVRTMLTRMSDPGLPGRTIYLNVELVIRKSCGSSLQNGKEDTESPAKNLALPRL